jgi:raffinose/stachyose/melibiose transport system substrate-binding protein
MKGTKKMLTKATLLAVTAAMCMVSPGFAAGRKKTIGNTSTAAKGISGELNIIHYLTETAKLKALDNMVAGFKAEYPNVKVNVESTSMDNYQDVIKLKISTGDAPDIIFGSCKTYSDLITSGNIEDISNQTFINRIAPAVLSNVQINKRVYGIPLDEMANVVFYNKDIFTKYGLKIPHTYSEFIAVCKKLQQNGVTACAAGYQDNISIGANFYTIFFGAPYLTCENYAAELAGGKSSSGYPALSKALTQWREIMQYQNTDRKTIDTDRAEQKFANGETGMIIIGTWGLGAIMNYNPKGNFGGFMYPSEEKEADNAVPVATDDTWMLVKNSQNKNAALAFCEYMTRKDVNSKWCATTSQLSAISGVIVDTFPIPMKDIAQIIAQKKAASWLSVGTFSGQYDTTWYRVLQDYAITDSISISDFCKQLDKEFAAAKK